MSVISLGAIANNVFTPGTASFTLPAVGSIVVIIGHDLNSATNFITGVTKSAGTGAMGTWARLAGPVSGNMGGNNLAIDMWWAKVVTGGTITLTPTWNTAPTGGNQVNVWATYTTSGVTAATVWTVDAFNTKINTASTTVSYPSLIPVGANDLFIGAAIAASTINTTGQTAGYTRNGNVSAPNFNALYNVNTTGTQAPTIGQASSDVSRTLGALIHCDVTPPSTGPIGKIIQSQGARKFAAIY